MWSTREGLRASNGLHVTHIPLQFYSIEGGKALERAARLRRIAQVERLGWGQVYPKKLFDNLNLFGEELCFLSSLTMPLFGLNFQARLFCRFSHLKGNGSVSESKLEFPLMHFSLVLQTAPLFFSIDLN